MIIPEDAHVYEVRWRIVSRDATSEASRRCVCGVCRHPYFLLTGDTAVCTRCAHQHDAREIPQGFAIVQVS